MNILMNTRIFFNTFIIQNFLGHINSFQNNESL